jgi:hypothetical protein
MKKVLSLLGLLAFAGSVVAQNHFYQQFSISDSTSFRPTLEEDLREDLVYLMDRRVTELIVEDRYAFEVSLLHQVSRLQTNAGIEAMNEIYIRLSEGSELLAAESRVISPDGQVKTLLKKDIREDKNYKGSGKMVFFALEGIEVGSVVEFFYIEKEPAKNVEYGRRFVQANVPKYAVDFSHVVPGHLEFEFKSYNGLPEVTIDESFEELLVYRFQIPRVPPIHDEKFAYPTASKMRFEYKLAKNKATGKKDFISYSRISENVFNNLNNDNSKKGLKMVDKELKKMKLEGMSVEEKIMAIERYVKLNYNLVRSTGRLFRTLEEIIPGKIADDNGAMRLFLALFNAAGIESEIVLTSDKTVAPFDPDFPNSSFLQTYLLYFPKTNKFLYPETDSYRYGYFPLKHWDNHGLFIRRVKIGDLITGAGKIKWIPAIPYDQNYDKFTVSIALDQTLENTNVAIRREMKGDHIINLQSNFSRMNEESLEQMKRIFVKFIDEDAEVVEYEFSNVEPDATPTKPMVVTATMKIPNLLESAGDKILVKVGDAIGRQSEMYQETTRELPISHHTHLYDRVVELTIPEGYRIANLEDINIEAACLLDGNSTALFKSYYRIEGNKIIINADEYYKDVSLPIELFNDFQKVINAAADFNKVVLVLEPIN